MKRIVVLLACLVLWGCRDNYGACEKAALNIGNGIAAGMQTIDSLRVAGKISVKEETNILGYLKFANDGNGVFAACAQQVHSSGLKTGYTTCATTLQQTLANPQELALIHVTDQTSQQDVMVVINGLNAGVSSLLIALGGIMIPDVGLALALLNTLLNFIAQLRAQGGLTDDALAAQVQAVTQKNDAAYAALMAALNPTTPTIPPPPAPKVP